MIRGTRPTMPLVPYMLASAVIVAGIAYALPDNWRPVWLAGATGFEGHVIVSNYTQVGW